MKETQDSPTPAPNILLAPDFPPATMRLIERRVSPRALARLMGDRQGPPPRKRDQVFTPELRDVTERVISHGENGGTPIDAPPPPMPEPTDLLDPEAEPGGLLELPGDEPDELLPLPESTAEPLSQETDVVQVDPDLEEVDDPAYLRSESSFVPASEQDPVEQMDDEGGWWNGDLVEEDADVVTHEGEPAPQPTTSEVAAAPATDSIAEAEDDPFKDDDDFFLADVDLTADGEGPARSVTPRSQQQEDSAGTDIGLDDDELIAHALSEEDLKDAQNRSAITKKEQAGQKIDMEAPAKSEELDDRPAAGSTEPIVEAGAQKEPTGPQEPAITPLPSPDELPPELLKERMPPLAPEFVSILKRIYTDENARPDDFQEILAMIESISGAQGSAFLFLNIHYMAYQCLAFNNIDVITARNFFLGLQDVYVDHTLEHQTLDITDSRRSAADFSKRFSTEFLGRFKALSFINLEPYGTEGYLALFFEKLPEEPLGGIAYALRPLIRDLVPALLRCREIAWYRSRSEQSETIMLDEIYQALRHLSVGGRQKICIAHVKFLDILEQSSWRIQLLRLANALATTITPPERVIVVAPDRLLIATRNTPMARVLRQAQESASEWGFHLRSREMEYPRDGRNMYNYIVPDL